MQNAYDLVMKYTPIAFNERDAQYCYGMSKMTVVDETEESEVVKYKRL